MTTRWELEEKHGGVPWQDLIVTAFNETGSIIRAAEWCGVTVPTFYAWMDAAGLRFEKGKSRLVKVAEDVPIDSIDKGMR